MMSPITCTPHVHKEKGNAANVAFGNQIDHWSGLSFDSFFCSPLSLTSQASITQAEKLAFGLSIFSTSTLASISSSSSWGKRMYFFADFLLMLPLATVAPHIDKKYVRTKYNKKSERLSIDMCAHLDLICAHSSILSLTENSETPSVSLPLTGFLTTNDNASIEVAMMNGITITSKHSSKKEVCNV